MCVLTNVFVRLSLFNCLVLLVCLLVCLSVFVSFVWFVKLILWCKKKASGGVMTPVMNPNGSAFAFFGRPNSSGHERKKERKKEKMNERN